MRILDVDEVAPSEAPGLTHHLRPGEPVHAAFVSPTGVLLFTERRILIVQREHLLEERVEANSFPYREVRHFSMSEGSSGRAAIRIWLGSEPHPLHLRANRGTGLLGLQHLLADRLG